jgi:hypothetical protein
MPPIHKALRLTDTRVVYLLVDQDAIRCYTAGPHLQDYHDLMLKYSHDLEKLLHLEQTIKCLGGTPWNLVSRSISLLVKSL